MSLSCSICSRADREAIDARLMNGERLVALSGSIGVSKSALGRHKLNCLAPRLKAAARVVEHQGQRAREVRRAKEVASGAPITTSDILSLEGMLALSARTVARLESAATDAADDHLYSALAAVSGQINRTIEVAARLQGLGAQQEQPQERFSIVMQIQQQRAPLVPSDPEPNVEGGRVSIRLPYSAGPNRSPEERVKLHDGL